MTIKQLVTHACTFAMLAAPLAGTACNNDTPTGTLIVPFEIGAGVECSVANVANVKVSLFDMPPDGDLSEEVETLTVPCSEGKAVFNNLPVDRYYITAEGIDGMDFTVVDNDASAETDLGEVLQGKENTANTVAMSPTPAQLWVRFALNLDDFQTMCPSTPIANFKVTASKSDGLAALLTTTIACDAVPEADGYHHIPDLNRDLEGISFNHVRVQALDETGNVIGDLKYLLAAPPGPGRIIKLTPIANCDGTNDTCTLACKGDSCTPD